MVPDPFDLFKAVWSVVGPHFGTGRASAGFWSYLRAGFASAWALLEPAWNGECGDWIALEERCRHVGLQVGGLLLTVAVFLLNARVVEQACARCGKRPVRRWRERGLKTTCGIVTLFRQDHACACGLTSIPADAKLSLPIDDRVSPGLALWTAPHQVPSSEFRVPSWSSTRNSELATRNSEGGHPRPGGQHRAGHAGAERRAASHHAWQEARADRARRGRRPRGAAPPSQAGGQGACRTGCARQAPPPERTLRGLRRPDLRAARRAVRRQGPRLPPSRLQRRGGPRRRRHPARHVQPREPALPRRYRRAHRPRAWRRRARHRHHREQVPPPQTPAGPVPHPGEDHRACQGSLPQPGPQAAPRHRDHLWYDEARQLGLGVGTGIAEKDVDLLLDRRYELRGMSWTPAGVRDNLRIRLALFNDMPAAIEAAVRRRGLAPAS